MIKNKKGQGVSINVVIVASIALLVLVVLIAIFIGRFGDVPEYDDVPEYEIGKTIFLCKSVYGLPSAGVSELELNFVFNGSESCWAPPGGCHDLDFVFVYGNFSNVTLMERWYCDKEGYVKGVREFNAVVWKKDEGDIPYDGGEDFCMYVGYPMTGRLRGFCTSRNGTHYEI